VKLAPQRRLSRPARCGVQRPVGPGDRRRQGWWFSSWVSRSRRLMAWSAGRACRSAGAAVGDGEGTGECDRRESEGGSGADGRVAPFKSATGVGDAHDRRGGRRDLVVRVGAHDPGRCVGRWCRRLPRELGGLLVRVRAHDPAGLGAVGGCCGGGDRADCKCEPNRPCCDVFETHVMPPGSPVAVVSGSARTVSQRSRYPVMGGWRSVKILQPAAFRRERVEVLALFAGPVCCLNFESLGCWRSSTRSGR
jgi:hypothetical protein